MENKKIKGTKDGRLCSCDSALKLGQVEIQNVKLRNQLNVQLERFNSARRMLAQLANSPGEIVKSYRRELDLLRRTVALREKELTKAREDRWKERAIALKIKSEADAQLKCIKDLEGEVDRLTDELESERESTKELQEQIMAERGESQNLLAKFGTLLLKAAGGGDPRNAVLRRSKRLAPRQTQKRRLPANSPIPQGDQQGPKRRRASPHQPAPKRRRMSMPVQTGPQQPKGPKDRKPQMPVQRRTVLRPTQTPKLKKPALNPKEKRSPQTVPKPPQSAVREQAKAPAVKPHPTSRPNSAPPQRPPTEEEQELPNRQPAPETRRVPSVKPSDKKPPQVKIEPCLENRSHSTGQSPTPRRDAKSPPTAPNSPRREDERSACQSPPTDPPSPAQTESPTVPQRPSPTVVKIEPCRENESTTQSSPPSPTIPKAKRPPPPVSRAPSKFHLQTVSGGDSPNTSAVSSPPVANPSPNPSPSPPPHVKIKLEVRTPVENPPSSPDEPSLRPSPSESALAFRPTPESPPICPSKEHGGWKDSDLVWNPKLSTRERILDTLKRASRFGGATGPDVGRTLDLQRTAVANHTKKLRTQGKIHISKWTIVKGRNVAVYMHGPGKNAPEPLGGLGPLSPEPRTSAPLPTRQPMPIHRVYQMGAPRPRVHTLPQAGKRGERPLRLYGRSSELDEKMRNFFMKMRSKGVRPPTVGQARALHSARDEAR